MRFGNNLYNKTQKNLAKRVCQSIKDGFALEDIPTDKIFGLDIESMKNDEISISGQTPKGIKEN